GSQQLTLGVQPRVPSMLGMHLVASQVARKLQFGPPSVASSTNVRPCRPENLGKRPASVAAVGVPPLGLTVMARENARVMGPSLPQYARLMGSPGTGG